MNIHRSSKNSKRHACLGTFFMVSLILFSCSKKKEVMHDNNTPVGHLSSFTVTVKERIPKSAIIEWTPSLSTFNSDTVKYKVFLNGTIVDFNLLNAIDTLTDLSKDTLYQGRVIAYTQRGDTASASFLLEKYNGFIYLVTPTDQRLGCYGSYTNGGTRLWNVPFKDQTGMPTISNDTLFLSKTYSPGGSSLCAFNAETGGIIWSSLTNTGLANGSSPTYYNGKLYASTGLGVLAMNSTNGQILWSYQNISNDLGTNPVIDNNKIFVGNRSNGGHISALNLINGSLIWDFIFSGQMCTRPLVSNNLVIFGTAQAKIYALDQNNGNIVWTRDLSVSTNNFGSNGVSPSIIKNNVIVHTANNGFYALNVLTGTTVWTYANYDPIVSSPAYGNGLMYFTTTIRVGSDYRAKIVAINASTGHLQWERTGYQPSLVYLIFAKNKLYLREYYNVLMVDPFTGNQQGHIVNLDDNISFYGVRINNVSYYNCEHGNYTEDKL